MKSGSQLCQNKKLNKNHVHITGLLTPPIVPLVLVDANTAGWLESFFNDWTKLYIKGDRPSDGDNTQREN